MHPVYFFFSVACSEDEMRCTNGLCLGTQYWCNGMDDCQDESDETDSICNSGKLTLVKVSLEKYVYEGADD